MQLFIFHKDWPPPARTKLLIGSGAKDRIFNADDSAPGPVPEGRVVRLEGAAALLVKRTRCRTLRSAKFSSAYLYPLYPCGPYPLCRISPCRPSLYHRGGVVCSIRLPQKRL